MTGDGSFSPLVCPNCKTELGQVYYLRGETVGVKLGGVMITTQTHGRCVSCNQGVWIGIPRESYAKLMRHYGYTPTVEIEFDGGHNE